MSLQKFINKFKSKILLSVFFCLMLMLPNISLAQGSTVGSDINRNLNAFAGEQGVGYKGPPADPRTVVGGIIEVFLSILGVLFVSYAIYAGYTIMSSGGEEEKIRKGKSTLQTAIIGIFVIFSAYSILYFVVGSVWFATEAKPPVYMEAGVGTADYDFYRARTP